jgi:hypothetical protein
MESVFVFFVSSFAKYYITGIVVLVGYCITHVRSFFKGQGAIESIIAMLLLSTIWPYVVFRIIKHTREVKKEG